MGLQMFDHRIVALIEDRAALTPRLTAVRLAGRAVTYDELRREMVAQLDLADSESAVDRPLEQAVHEPAAVVFSALMSMLPFGLRAAGIGEDVLVVGAAMAWLATHLESGDSTQSAAS